MEGGNTCHRWFALTSATVPKSCRSERSPKQPGPKIAKTFPFAQTVDAYRYLESNAQVGKIVITVP